MVAQFGNRNISYYIMESSIYHHDMKRATPKWEIAIMTTNTATPETAKSKPITLPPDGTLTPAIRQRLKSKRIELGAALKQLAGVLDLDWGTLSKWENGKVRRCSISNRRRLEKFLNGGYDRVLQDENLPGAYMTRDTFRLPPGLVPEIAPTLQRVQLVYALCRHRPDLQQELQKQLETVSDTVLSKLAEP